MNNTVWMILQSLVNGVMMGGVYALISVGLTIIFGVMKVVNFAQGEYLVIGMYVTLVLSQLTGLTIDMSVPSMTVDMLGAIMSVPIIEFSQVGDKVLFIDDGFAIDGVDIKSNIILIPEMDSLETLMKKLGVM